jgi:glycosyltransferase involved in cell wall biosynthesis
MLERAIASVLRQSYGSFELIVVDDGSVAPARLPDDGAERSRLIRNPRSLGAARARNRGIAAAAGKLLCFLDDDDELHPDFLARTRDAFQSCPSASFSWCDVRFMDYADGKDSTGRIHTFESGPPAQLILDALSIGTGFGLTVRAECFAEIGDFDTAFRFTEDTEFLFRLLVAGYRPVVVKGALVTIHNHQGPRMTDLANAHARALECETLLASYRGFVSAHEEVGVRLMNHIVALRGGTVSGSGAYLWARDAAEAEERLEAEDRLIAQSSMAAKSSATSNPPNRSI